MRYTDSHRGALSMQNYAQESSPVKMYQVVSLIWSYMEHPHRLGHEPEPGGGLRQEQGARERPAGN